MIRPAKNVVRRPKLLAKPRGAEESQRSTELVPADLVTSDLVASDLITSDLAVSDLVGSKPATGRTSMIGHPREELWTKFLRTRWRKHRNLLVEAYLPLVRSIAENIASRLPRSIEAEDLVSVGIFGLLQSVENFDPDRGTKFETFCRRRIRGAIIDELRSQDFLSREARMRANLVAEATQRLVQELGREPNLREVAEALGLEVRDVDTILSQVSSHHVVSLDAALRDPLLLDEDGVLSPELVDGGHEPFELAQKKDLLERIAGSLKAEEREIVLLRYRDGLTMRDIGRILGVSESRVCQLHTGVLTRLQRRLAFEE